MGRSSDAIFARSGSFCGDDGSDRIRLVIRIEGRRLVASKSSTVLEMLMRALMRNLMILGMLLMLDLLLLLVHVQPWRVDATHRSRVDDSRVGDMIELGLMDAIGGMRRPGVHVDRE